MNQIKTILSQTEAIFVTEYLVNGNDGTLAYQKAFPKCKSKGSAAVGATRLLKRPKVAAALSAASQRVVDTAATYAGIDKAYIMGKLNENLDRAMQAEPVRDSEGKETGLFTYQGNVANKAAELMGKEIGMFVQRIAGPSGEPLPAPDNRTYINGIDFSAIRAKAGKK